jgi:hypothetical protein
MSRKRKSSHESQPTPVCPECGLPFEELASEDRQIYRLGDDFAWICRHQGKTPAIASNETRTVDLVKHVFDPACECANCLSKRGKTMAYLYTPDSSSGPVFQSESPKEEQHRIAGFKIGREKGQQELEDRAEAILAARAAGPVKRSKAAKGEPQAPRLTVSLEKRIVTLDGQSFDVSSGQALRWLKVLIEHAREWISSADLQGLDKELAGARPDRLKKYLPDSVQELIDSEPGKGSRLRLE